MLVDLYPRVHRRYASLAVIGPIVDILDGYGTWLLKQGYSTERTREHLQAAPRLVRGLQQGGVQALTSLTRARLRACAPTDSQEDPNLAVLVQQTRAVLRVRAVVVSAAGFDPDRAASRRLRDLSTAGPGVRAVDPDAPRPHGRRVLGAHGLRDAPGAARRARPPESRHLPVRRRPPPVACIPAACGGPPLSLPPVPGVCRREPDWARHADRHAAGVSRREAPTGAALGHGAGAPVD